MAGSKDYYYSWLLLLINKYVDNLNLLIGSFNIIDEKLGITSHNLFTLLVCILIYYLIVNFNLKYYSNLKVNFFSICGRTLIHVLILFSISLFYYNLPGIIERIPEGCRLSFLVAFIVCLLGFIIVRLAHFKKFSFIKYVLVVSSSFLLRMILIMLMPIFLPSDYSQIGVDILTTSFLSTFVPLGMEYGLIQTFLLDEIPEGETYARWRLFYSKPFAIPNPNEKLTLLAKDKDYIIEALTQIPSDKVPFRASLYNLEEIKIITQLYNTYKYPNPTDVVFVSPTPGKVLPIPYSKVIPSYFNDCPEEHIPVLFTNNFMWSIYKSLGPLENLSDYSPRFRGIMNENVLIKQDYLENGVVKSVILCYEKQAEIQNSFIRYWDLNTNVCVILPKKHGVYHPIYGPFDTGSQPGSRQFYNSTYEAQLCVKLNDRGYVPLKVRTSGIVTPDKADIQHSSCLKPYYDSTLNTLKQSNPRITSQEVQQRLERWYTVVNSPILSEVAFNQLNWKPAN